MASGSRLTELTNIIATETEKIDQFFAKNGIPHLSFDPDAPADFPVPSSNAEIQEARRTIVNATKELHDLMVGPRETIRWMAWSVRLQFLSWEFCSVWVPTWVLRLFLLR